VLNALRHQRVGSVPAPRAAPSSLVCAQRLTASEGWISAAQSLRSVRSSVCSTPYGIRGLDQFAEKDYHGTQQPVLNALRHQRVGSGSFGKDCSFGEGWCSTPYGIRGLDQCHHVGQCRLTQRCSTPYGIRGLDQKSLLRKIF